jgi:AcrR family transcriptional regulator
MARPRSEDKRNAILAAALTVIAEQGESAPTARIAKLAGVAEGTLFTYFSSKDELLNHLYLQLKSELREAIVKDYPWAESLKNQSRHAWKAYVDWGFSEKRKRKVLSQLATSDRISLHCKEQGMQTFADIGATIHDGVAKGLLRDYPPMFLLAMLGSLADITIDFMMREPEQAEKYCENGYEAFWNAISI